MGAFRGMTSQPWCSAHPLLEVQVDLSVEQLVVVVVMEIPLAHHFFYGSAVSHNSWGWQSRKVKSGTKKLVIEHLSIEEPQRSHRWVSRELELHMLRGTFPWQRTSVKSGHFWHNLMIRKRNPRTRRPLHENVTKQGSSAKRGLYNTVSPQHQAKRKQNWLTPALN